MIWLTAFATMITALFGSQVPPAKQQSWVYPVGAPDGPADVVHRYDPPAQRWLAGHRGVDLGGTVGSTVSTAAAGHVSYAGLIAGIGVVVVDHGSIRTTYQPVEPSVTQGDVLRAGDPIGTLSALGSHCSPAACLHWGARDQRGYADPLRLMGAVTRLLPLGGRSVSGAPSLPVPPLAVPPSAKTLSWPVAAPHVTSPFGMRVHPITGVRKLHDGTDFGAPCGTAVHAAAAGQITHVGVRGAYGLQVTVEHGAVDGARITTSYSHLSRALLAAGQPVQRGQLIGQVGTTGLSTGCHLHFMVYADGTLADPGSYLPAGRANTLSAPARRQAQMSASAGSRWPRHVQHAMSPLPRVG